MNLTKEQLAKYKQLYVSAKKEEYFDFYGIKPGVMAYYNTPLGGVHVARVLYCFAQRGRWYWRGIKVAQVGQYWIETGMACSCPCYISHALLETIGIDPNARQSEPVQNQSVEDKAIDDAVILP